MGVTQSGSVVFAAVLSLFLVPILTFYLLRDWDSIMAHLAALIPSAQQDTIMGLARETDDMLGAFLRGQLLVMLALSLIYSVGLGIVGLEFAIAIGVVSGLVSFVPYLGFVFGIALASLTVALDPAPLWKLVGRSYWPASRADYLCDCRRWTVVRVFRHPPGAAGGSRTLGPGSICLRPLSQGSP
jgi:predicted PurR-regulated permease PerM